MPKTIDNENIELKFCEPEILQKIKSANKFKDFIILSANDLFLDNLNKKQTELFLFPPYKDNTEEKKQKDLYNDIDYDSEDFDKLKKVNIDININKNDIENNLNKSYQNQQLTTEKPKYSVSEIKQNKIDLDTISTNAKSININMPSDDENLNEDKINDIVRMDGTELGNLLHSFMEHYDFDTDVENFINNAGGETHKFIKLKSYIPYINNFLSSELGKNMKDAKNNNKLYREQRFMIEVPLEEVKHYMNITESKKAKASDDVEANTKSPQVIIQGVIDAFYINNYGNIVLIDYKTDGLSTGKISKDKLVNNYKLQMDIYERALNQITTKTIEKKYIYSFALNEAISM